MKTPFTVVPGQFFDAGVVDAGDPKPAAQSPRVIPDPILEALVDLHMATDDKDEEKTLGALIDARVKQNKVARPIIDEARARWRAHLAVEHEDVKARGRKQELVLRQIAKTIAETQQGKNLADNKVAQATSDLRAAEQARRNVGRFASNKKIAEAQSALEAARARVDAAQAKAAGAWQNLHQLAEREFDEKKKLSAIHTELVRIEAQINGGTYTDPEFGLVLPGHVAGSFDPPAA